MDKRLAHDLLRSMIVTRVFEEKVAEMIRTGVIVAHTHSYVGEEAIAAGVGAALHPEDYVFSTHRNHGHCLAKGMEPWRMLAEMLGREGATCKGQGGDNHQGDVSRRMLGGNNIVGGGIPLAAGAAYVQKYRQTGAIVACFFGDGAVNQGLFHEGINLAVILKVPVLYVLENNQYAISTHISRVTAVLPLAQKARAYGIEAVTIDGNDVALVYETSRRLAERVRTTQEPALIECETYRFEPHWSGDWGGYRTREEVETYRQRDPIKLFGTRLLTEGTLTQPELDHLYKEARTQIDGAAQMALSQKPLGKEVLFWEVAG
jgi:acetoin:2,6-dichlorophenolindophenol oxidoreductase subunit alpha